MQLAANQRKFSLIIIFLICSITLFSQHLQDSVEISLPNEIVLEENSADKQASGMEIYKLTSKRNIRVAKNQSIRVDCYQKKGFRRVKSAVITEIKDHQITFKPRSKRFDEITYVDSAMTYLEFTTGGSVFRGIIINTLLISSIVIIVGAVIVVTLYAVTHGGSSGGGGGNGFGRFVSHLPWDNFNKHIKVYNHKGIRKWGVRTI